jgi:hypothetical protein
VCANVSSVRTLSIKFWDSIWKNRNTWNKKKLFLFSFKVITIDCKHAFCELLKVVRNSWKVSIVKFGSYVFLDALDIEKSSCSVSFHFKEQKMLASARSVCSPRLDSPRSFSPLCQHMIIYETRINFVHISQLICRLSSVVDSCDGLRRPVHELTEFSAVEGHPTLFSFTRSLCPTPNLFNQTGMWSRQRFIAVGSYKHFVWGFPSSFPERKTTLDVHWRSRNMTYL